ncbi:ATP-binding protein, partial [Sulfurimonas sp. SAG-AH-194-C21]|nr:ATP-binding protein [Sulfurimonas sp. SAG-AH-194-C21]
MNLANDYFLLYHGISLEKELEHKTLSITLNSETLSLFCILLIVRRKDFEKFIALDSFTSFFQTLHYEKTKHIEELYSLQWSLLTLLEKNNSAQNISIIHDIFLKLKEENILSYENHKKLSSLFEYSDHCTLELPSLQKKEFLFQEEQKHLQECIITLREKIFDTTLLEQLKHTSEYLYNQKFSIGITGVINAGKSTMLNALLGEELLG